MAHILFITPHYPPEKAAPAVRISETARLLVEYGHRVTVLTTLPNYPSGIVPPGYRGRIVRREVCEGVRVVRVWSYITANKGFLRRILAQLSFGCLAPFLGARAAGRPDVIIVESPPLFDAIAGLLLSWYRRCPFIFTVADIWPESAIQLGVLRNRTAICLAEWLEWMAYRKADKVWALTTGIKQTLIRHGLAPEHIFLLTNGVDTTRFQPFPRSEARAELGWDARFTVLYAGTHGLSHGLTTVLDAAKRLLDHSGIRFVLVGDGAARAGLVARARERHLVNVAFLDPLPHEQVPLLLSAANACLVPLRKLPLFEGALPSKMYEAMACACPILLGVDGEARRLAEQEAGAALYVEPENADALASAILYLYAHPEVAKTLGEHGRAYVEAHFNRDRLTKILEAQIEAVSGRQSSFSEAIAASQRL